MIRERYVKKLFCEMNTKAPQKPNHFFAKKVEFCETWQKRVHRLLVSSSSFREQIVNYVWSSEKCLCVSFEDDSVERRQYRMKNLFAKHQQKHTTHYLCFVAFSSVRPFFVVVRE